MTRTQLVVMLVTAPLWGALAILVLGGVAYVGAACAHAACSLLERLIERRRR